MENGQSIAEAYSMENNPNVLLVVLDSVRARNTTLHGYETETTPFLKTFADAATTYTQARAPGVGSVPSHASMFTGLHVAEHRMRNVGQQLQSGSTVWDDLATDGYDTGVFSYNSYLTQAPVGFADSFETIESGADQRLPHPRALDPADLESGGKSRYVEFLRRALADRPLQSLHNGLRMWTKGIGWIPASLRATEEVNGSVFTDLFLDWLDDRDGSWAACLNYMDAHVPYIPEPEHNHWADAETVELMRDIDEHVWEFVAGKRPWSQRHDLERLYDGCIRQIDTELKRVVGGLRERGLLEDTLVVVTADHGEGFAEDGEVRPARSLAHGNTGGIEEGILHVPLVVSFPDDVVGDAGRVTAPASLTQFPEVVRQVRAGTAGRDCFVPDDGPVLASMQAIPDTERDTIPSFVDDFSVYVPGGEVVYRAASDRVRKHVVWENESSTLDVTDSADPEELSADDDGVVADAYEGLTKSDAVIGASVEPSAEVETRLEELGYR